jgi:hypothetical protein
MHLIIGFTRPFSVVIWRKIYSLFWQAALKFEQNSKTAYKHKRHFINRLAGGLYWPPLLLFALSGGGMGKAYILTLVNQRYVAFNFLFSGKCVLTATCQGG